MNPDVPSVWTLRQRRNQLQGRPPDEETLRELLRLRRELAAFQDAAHGSPDVVRKFRLLQQHFAVKPVAVPEDAPARLGEIARSLEGQLWSPDLLAWVEQQLEALASGHRDARERAAAVRLEAQQARQQCRILRAYVELLDALAGVATNRRE